MEEGEEIQWQIGKCSRSLKRDQSRAHRLVGAHATDRWALRKRAACDARRQLPALRRLSREVNIT